MSAAIARTFYRFVGGNTTVPVTLGLRNIYILPTGYGLLYMAVLVAMLIGSINYNNNLGFLLTFLLGSLGLVAMMHTYGTLYGLRLTAATAVPVFAGASLVVDITIAGIDRPRMGLCWYIDPEEQSEVDLTPGGTGRVAVRVPTRHRGRVIPGWLRIACDYPLGLFRAWSRIDPNLTGIVYPRPLPGPLPAAGMSWSTDAADGQTVITAGVDDFEGLAAYQPGDPPGRIHWQAFSRGRGLHTKRFTGQGGREAVLDIDRMGGADIEKKLSTLCFHVMQTDRQGRGIGLKLGRETITVGRGAVHRERCLRALALYEKD